jgi:hypothetical protein
MRQSCVRAGFVDIRNTTQAKRLSGLTDTVLLGNSV